MDYMLLCKAHLHRLGPTVHGGIVGVVENDAWRLVITCDMMRSSFCVVLRGEVVVNGRLAARQHFKLYRTPRKKIHARTTRVAIPCNCSHPDGR
jgi:hypothetical protein